MNSLLVTSQSNPRYTTGPAYRLLELSGLDEALSVLITLSRALAMAEVRCVSSLVLSATCCCVDMEYAAIITCLSELLILASMELALLEAEP